MRCRPTWEGRGFCVLARSVRPHPGWVGLFDWITRAGGSLHNSVGRMSYILEAMESEADGEKHTDFLRRLRSAIVARLDTGEW